MQYVQVRFSRKLQQAIWFSVALTNSLRGLVAYKH